VIDLYRVLGVERRAPRDEIHQAYRRKAKISHPDSGGSVEAFGEVATAYTVLSDTKRRERYDTTGEIELPRADILDASAIEIIAQKLGLVIHAEQDVTGLDIAALIEGAIREDIAQRRSNISSQSRAIERTTKLRARVKRKANGQDNMLAKVLDWHEVSARDQIKKNEAAVSSMERALEILTDYSFADDLAPAAGDEVSGALLDALEALDQLAAVLKTGPNWCDVDVARPSASG
jgi:curved DNA-binding protein CbpA